jgi:tripartite-type tricarboxylate transporter receptor subunit TctC
VSGAQRVERGVGEAANGSEVTMAPLARTGVGGLGRWGILLAIVGLVTGATTASAQPFPNRTVRIVVPFTPGGANDGIARAMADRLTKKWNQPVVVENRPGGATTIGTRAVIDASPDGHTLLFTSSTSFVVTPHTTRLAFDPLADLEPVLLAVSVSPAMAVGNHVQAKTVPELIAVAKASPGKLTYASAGTGTYSHVAVEHFKRLAGIDMVHVPYSGTSPAITDMLGGRIDVYMVAIGVFQDLEKAGKLKLVAMATPARHPDRPSLPTIGETLQDYAVDVWFGFSAPRKTPVAILDQLHGDMSEILRDPAFVDAFIRPQGFTAQAVTRAQFTERLKRDHALWGEMVAKAGLTK